MYQEWLSLIPYIKLDLDRAARCVILEPKSFEEDLLRAEKASGIEIPLAARLALENWNEQGSNFLLNGLPQVLNPGASKGELEPTGFTTAHIFPEFWQMLRSTKQFAIIIDPSTNSPHLKVLLAGLGSEVTDIRDNLRTINWSYYLPQDLESVQQHEMRTNMKLSPQLKQLLLCANGAPDDLTCPYFSKLELLEKGLLAEIYEDLIDEESISDETFQKLKDFVVLYEDVLGNAQGFFIDERQPNGEYPIYDWDHETMTFSRWSNDFAGSFQRKLVKGW